MNLSNSAINKIGNIMRDGKEITPEYKQAIEKLNIWREAHGSIMNEYYAKCAKLANKINENIIVAQRLKRLPTIIGKLDRFKTMRLSSMQDIAGVRIIASDMTELKNIENHIKKWKNLIRIDDYIKQPKDSGYRSKHFIFKKDNMLVEIQLRTKLQHLWSTSVETTDLFRGTSLKEKDDSSYWHNFFCQVSSVFAIAEKTPPTSEYKDLTINEICNLLQTNITKNSINSQIAGFAIMHPIVDYEKTKDTYYIIIDLKPNKKIANVYEFPESMYDVAFGTYRKLEQKKTQNQQIVLIGLNQVKKLQSAYPNYFVDLTGFIDTIKFLLEENKKISYNKSNE